MEWVTTELKKISKGVLIDCTDFALFNFSLLFPCFLIKPLPLLYNWYFIEHLDISYFSFSFHSQNHVQYHPARVQSALFTKVPAKRASLCWNWAHKLLTKLWEGFSLKRRERGKPEETSAHQPLNSGVTCGKGEGQLFPTSYRFPVV